MRSIYEVIFELRSGKPTIVRAVDLYVPVLASWRKAGIAEVLHSLGYDPSIPR